MQDDGPGADEHGVPRGLRAAITSRLARWIVPSGTLLGLVANVAQFISNPNRTQLLGLSTITVVITIGILAIIAILMEARSTSVSLPVPLVVLSAISFLLFGGGFGWALGNVIFSARDSVALSDPPPSTPTLTGPSTSPGETTTSPSSQATPVAVITEPTNGQTVGVCKIVRGTSGGLPPGMTLVTVKHQNSAWYVERPSNWDEPRLLSTWQDTQTFNHADGERFSIRVYAVPMDFVSAEKSKPENDPTWALESIPADWIPLDSVDVVVDSMKVKADCEG
jgi:hypothetical protein